MFLFQQSAPQDELSPKIFICLHSFDGGWEFRQLLVSGQKVWWPMVGRSPVE